MSAEPNLPEPAPELSPTVAAYVQQMQGFLNTLAAIGTPEAVAAIEALDAAMTGMSAALNLASAAMIAVTPTTH